MPRTLLVFGTKTFKITIPDEAKVTFGPFSPPQKEGKDFGYGSSPKAVGTLRIYKNSEKDVIAVFTGVAGFRDLSIGFAEEVAKEEGATIWKDDQEGYMREEKIKHTKEWVDPVMLPPGAPTPKPAAGKKKGGPF